MKSNVSHLLTSITALVNALRASGEVVNDAKLVAALDKLNGHAATLTDAYHRWWQTWQRTSSTVYCPDEAGQRNMLTLHMERLSKQAQIVCGMIEVHAADAASIAHDQAEQFARSAKFSLSELLWGHSRIIPMLVESLSFGISEKVAFALSLETAAK